MTEPVPPDATASPREVIEGLLRTVEGRRDETADFYAPDACTRRPIPR
jgi:hypothetical protein